MKKDENLKTFLGFWMILLEFWGECENWHVLERVVYNLRQILICVLFCYVFNSLRIWQIFTCFELFFRVMFRYRERVWGLGGRGLWGPNPHRREGSERRRRIRLQRHPKIDWRRSSWRRRARGWKLGRRRRFVHLPRRLPTAKQQKS